jgi:hypothetical protein
MEKEKEKKGFPFDSRDTYSVLPSSWTKWNRCYRCQKKKTCGHGDMANIGRIHENTRHLLGGDNIFVQQPVNSSQLFLPRLARHGLASYRRDLARSVSEFRPRPPCPGFETSVFNSPE